MSPLLSTARNLIPRGVSLLGPRAFSVAALGAELRPGPKDPVSSSLRPLRGKCRAWGGPMLRQGGLPGLRDRSPQELGEPSSDQEPSFPASVLLRGWVWWSWGPEVWIF